MQEKEKRLNYVPAVLNSIEKNMTSLDFISSEAVQNYLEHHARLITGNNDVNVVFRDYPYTYTDGESIVMSPGSAAAATGDLYDAFRIMVAMMFHEALHISMTDLKIYNLYIRGIIEGTTLPGMNFVYKIYRKHVVSIVEDGAVNRLGRREYGGIFAECMDFAEKTFYAKRPSLKEQYVRGAKEFDILCDAIQTYITTQKDPVFPPELGGLRAVYEKCRPLCDEACILRDTSERCLVTEQIFQYLRPYFDKFLGIEEYYPDFRPIVPSGHNDFREEIQAGLRKKDQLRRRRKERDFDEEYADLRSAAAREIYDGRMDIEASDKIIRHIGRLESTGLGVLHKDIKIDFIPARPQDFKNYHEIHRRRMIKLRPKIRILLKQFMETIQREHDNTIRRLYAGNRYLEPLRADKKCCAQRILQAEEADLFIYVLVDGSGSMNFDIENVKNALTLLSEVCKAMKIPLTIVCHSAGGDTVTLRTLVDANLRKNTFSGIETYTASGSTRDGVALLSAAEYLKTRYESQKLVIAISDGKPWHSHHIGEAGDNLELGFIARKIGAADAASGSFFDEYANFSDYDIRNIIRNTRINPVGIALAPTMPEAKLLYNDIRSLYPQSFATDLGHLAKELSKIIERNFFEEI